MGEEIKSNKRSDSQLSRNPSDSSSSKNSASTASVHSTNLGKPAPNLSFVARPEKPTVATEEKGRGISKEEEKKASEGGVGVGGVSGGGSSIGWNSDVLRGRASGAERVDISTNAEFTNGTNEAKESQEVADLKASVMSMQAEFNLQLAALRRELEEERMARTRLEQEVRSLKKLASSK